MEFLGHVGNLTAVHIRPPDPAVIDIPAVPRVVHKYDAVVVVYKHTAVPDLERLIAGIRVGIESRNGRIHTAIVRSKGVALLFPPVPLLLDGARIEIPEILLRIGFHDGTINLRCGCDGIPDCNSTIGCIPCHPVPLVTHQGRRTKNSVDLFFHAPTPEGKDRNQSHIGIRLGVIVFLPVPLIKSFELLPGLRVRCVGYHSIIVKV